MKYVDKAYISVTTTPGQKYTGEYLELVVNRCNDFISDAIECRENYDRESVCVKRKKKEKLPLTYSLNPSMDVYTNCYGGLVGDRLSLLFKVNFLPPLSHKGFCFSAHGDR